jgi:hypothetical protein
MEFRQAKVHYPGIIIRDVNDSTVSSSNNKTGFSIKIKYPIEEKERGIMGTVFCRYIVDTLGHVIDYKIIKGLGGGFDKEITRVLIELTKTYMMNPHPRKKNGKAVIYYEKEKFKFELH